MRIRREEEHLQRPGSVGLGEAQVDEAGHRQSHIEPVAEAEVVDELEDVLHTQKDQPHQPLQPHRLTRSVPFQDNHSQAE